MTSQHGPHRNLFLLRWNEKSEWAQVSLVTCNRSPPVPLGYVWLSSDAVFETLAWEYSLPSEQGMREVLVTGCLHYRPAVTP